MTLLLVAIGMPGVAAAEGLFSLSRFSTKAAVEIAAGLHSPALQKSELSLESTLEASIVGGVDLVAIGRLRADPADELNPGDPVESEVWKPSRRLRLGDDGDLGLRELYLHRRFGDTHVTIGKQQVVWGTCDGIKMLDLVNPQDSREFILDDFVDSRLPTWMLNLNRSFGTFQGQLLWIPDRSYTDLPERGSVYEFTSPQFVPAAPPGVIVDVQHPRRPSRFFEDSEVGFRLTTTREGVDLSLNYLWAFDDQPVPRRHLDSGPDGIHVVVTPEYRRTHYVGGSISRALGEFVLRGEMVFSSERSVYTLDAADPDGLLDGREISWVAGLDWFGLRNTLASVQVFTRYTDVDHKVQAPEGGWSVLPTLLLRRTLWSDRVTAQVFLIQDIGRGDGMARGSLRWDVRDNVTLSVGADFFYGPSKGIFGEFDDADRLVFGVESTI